MVKHRHHCDVTEEYMNVWIKPEPYKGFIWLWIKQFDVTDTKYLAEVH